MKKKTKKIDGFHDIFQPSIQQLVEKLQITQNSLLTQKSLLRMHKMHVRDTTKCVEEYQKQIKYLISSLRASTKPK
jgi:hypothetical protein